MAELIDAKEGAFINPPFYCDYGKHIHVGKNFFANYNYNCTVIDVAPVTRLMRSPALRFAPLSQ